MEAALHYASLGWRIFPLAPGQKVPITAHGVKDATIDESQIRAWWKKWPSANIGLACGEESGLYVIDVDVSASGDVNGLTSLAQFPILPVTIQQDTPRGGFHAFYKTSHPPANRNSFRPGIDIRGNGYYVVLAPSIHPNGGRYSWSRGCAPWEMAATEYPDFMRPATRAPWATPSPALPPSVAPQPQGDGVIRRAGLYLAQCDPAIQGQGGHDKLLWAATAMVHGFQLSDGQAYDLLTHEYNPRCVPPWDFSIQQDDRDFRRKIIEARKLIPKNDPGWLLNDPAYRDEVPNINISVDSLLSSVSIIRNGAIAKMQELAALNEELQYLTRPSGLLGEICSWINSTAIKEQPFLSLACSLAFLGSLFGRKVRDALGSRTNLYCMGVAPSSAGKAHAMNQIRLLCEASGCTHLLGGDDIASDAAIEKRVSRQPATLFLWDEIGHLLTHIKSGVSRNHAQVVSLLMKLYSAAGNIYLGKEYADDEKQRTIIQPCCCIYGTSTQERFTSGISQEELQDGWLSRCLVFSSNANPEKNRNIAESTTPQGIIDRVHEWSQRDLSSPTDGHAISQFISPSGNAPPPVQIVVSTDKRAEGIFIDFENTVKIYGKQSPAHACMWSKAEEQARRIALIIASGDNFDQPTITAANAEYACRLMRYLLRDFIESIVPEVTNSRTERDKRRLIVIVDSASVQGRKKSSLTRLSQWLDKSSRDRLLADLIEAEEIVATMHNKTTYYWTAVNYAKMQTKDA